MKSITIIRNKQITGNNSKSYNDKHPENPISLRPIRDLCTRIGYKNISRRTISMLERCDRPLMAYAIATLYP